MQKVTYKEIRTVCDEYEAASKEYFAGPPTAEVRARFQAASRACQELKERNGGPLYATYSA